MRLFYKIKYEARREIYFDYVLYNVLVNIIIEKVTVSRRFSLLINYYPKVSKLKNLIDYIKSIVIKCNTWKHLFQFDFSWGAQNVPIW